MRLDIIDMMLKLVFVISLGALFIFGINMIRHFIAASHYYSDYQASRRSTTGEGEE